MDPVVFKDPTIYCPERWLEGDVAELEKYMCSFSGGSRGCLGNKYVHTHSIMPFRCATTDTPGKFSTIFSYLLILKTFQNIATQIPPSSHYPSHPSSLTIHRLSLPPLKIPSLTQTLRPSLAYAELYLTLAHLFRRFDLSLYQTTEKDVEWDDSFVPITRGHLKVLIQRARD